MAQQTDGLSKSDVYSVGGLICPSSSNDVMEGPSFIPWTNKIPSPGEGSHVRHREKKMRKSKLLTTRHYLNECFLKMDGRRDGWLARPEE